MPSNEHIFLCGETAKGQSLGANTYALSLHGLDPNITLRIEDVSGPMVADIPDVLLDLLEVAAFVYAADACVSRGGVRDAEWGKRWRRNFRLTIPVRTPTLWTQASVLEPLTETLSMLSDDSYAFSFVDLAQRPERQAYFKFDETAPKRPRVDYVQLFSGGVDSFAGAAERLAQSDVSLALVSHRSAPQLAKTQLQLIGALQKKFGKSRVMHIPVWAQLTDRANKESTHRARSFLFAALAAVVARLFEKDACAFYENGVTSLNLPISRQVVGARATRSTHPVALKGFGQIFSALLGRPFAMKNPYADRTKTEIVEAAVQSGMQDSIRDTRSCAKVRSATIQYPHCGVCSQCIDRRLAVVAAHAEVHDPEEAYETDLFLGSRPAGPDRAMALGMVEIARRMHREDEDEVFRSFPEITRAVQGSDSSADAAAKNILDLMRRHGRAVVTALERGVDTHKRALAEGTLPADSLLALLGGGNARQPEIPVIRDDELRLPQSDVVELVALKNGKVRIGNETLSGQQAEVIMLLAGTLREDQAEQRHLSEHRTLSAKEIADGLGWTEAEAVRQCISRCRRRLSQILDLQPGDDDNVVIENIHRRGYRLNPRTVHLAAEV